MAGTTGINAALARLRRLPRRDGFAHLPSTRRFEQLCRDGGFLWRRRLLTPSVTFQLFLLQVLHGNIAINALRQLSGLCFAAASYCEARARLPLAALQQVLAELSQGPSQWGSGSGVGVGSGVGAGSGRVYVADSSGCSMPDTPPLRRRFGLPGPARVGVSYPMSMIMGLLDVASGLFVRAAAFPVFVRDQPAAAVAVNDALRSGDILVADRALCSFCQIALLWQRDVFCCFRLHQSRRVQRLGVVRWSKNRSWAPAWLSARQFATLPQELTVRVMRYRIRNKGYRTRAVLLATTLLDRSRWSDRRVAELYRQRWEVETCFAHLKTTMKMDVFKCKTVVGVLKELAVYLIAYNLVRLAMLQWAQTRGVPPRRVSFIDALRLLGVRALGLAGVATLIVNPDRTGRRQLRVRRRRPKHFPLLRRPRARQVEINYYRRRR